jgi:hypothetical protein
MKAIIPNIDVTMRLMQNSISKITDQLKVLSSNTVGDTLIIDHMKSVELLDNLDEAILELKRQKAILVDQLHSGLVDDSVADDYESALREKALETLIDDFASGNSTLTITSKQLGETCENCMHNIPNSSHCDTCFNGGGFKRKLTK